MRRLTLLVCFFLAALAAALWYAATLPTVVAFGDSLTQGVGSSEPGGYVPFLSQAVGVPIKNAGVAGDTTRDALARLPAVISSRPDIVILLFGGNDFLRHIPPAETFTNITTLITELQNAGADVLLAGLQSDVPGNRDRELFDTLARETGAAYVPDILEGIWRHPEMMSDNLHPNDAGYRLMAERLAPTLKALLAK